MDEDEARTRFPLLLAAGYGLWDEIPFEGPFGFEGRATSDGRTMLAGSLTTRPLPLPFMLLTETGERHDGAEICGRIDSFVLEGDVWYARGRYNADECGWRAAELAVSRSLRGVSLDVAVIDGQIITDLDDEGMPIRTRQEVMVGEIMGATQCPFPAFAEAEVLVPNPPAGMVTPDEEPEDPPDQVVFPIGPGSSEEPEVLVAAGTDLPDAAWFLDPQLDGPTALQVEGRRIFGHIACWSTCHTSFSGECITPPRSRTDYAYFRLGEIETTDGRVAVGQLTLDTGHAAEDPNMAWTAVAAHYDDTGTAVADVVAGEDEHGIWIAGALRASLSPDHVATLQAAKPSGDWRYIGGGLELVGLLSVNVPGFPVPRMLVAAGRPRVLVAALAPHISDEPITVEQVESPQVSQALRSFDTIMAAGVPRVSLQDWQRRALQSWDAEVAG